MKAEELIKNNALQNIEVAGKQKVVFECIAHIAVTLHVKRRKSVRLMHLSLFWTNGFMEVMQNAYWRNLKRNWRERNEKGEHPN